MSNLKENSKRIPITVDEYLKGDEMCIAVTKKKYLKPDTQLISDCFDTIIRNICNVSTETDADSKEQFIDTVYQDWIDGVWKGAGSIMSSANDIDRKVSIANCSTIVIPEDTLEGILDTKKYATKMAAHRQGFGVHFDAIRPKGSPINNSAEVSQGSVHWMKSFDRIGDDAGQLGRRPAILFSLSVNHLDVEEFIMSKKDLNVINNANISVHVTDAFMQCVNANGVWHQEFVFKDGTKVEKDVSAKKLFKTMCNNAWETGEPGLQFIDKMKRWSIQEALGYQIVASNACGEKPMPNESICCLAPLNMAKVPNPFKDQEAFHKFMKRVVYNMVRFMDNVIQFEIDHPYKSPTDKQRQTVIDLREIGLGIVNLHAWFYNNKVAYDSEEAIELTSEFFKWYQYYAFIASAELSKERGPAPAWKKHTLKELEKLETPFLTNLFSTFPNLKQLYYTTGIRNGAFLSVAPTGTISMTFPDFISTGIEPLMGYAYWRKTRSLNTDQTYTYFFVLPKVVNSLLLIAMSDNKAASEDIEFIKHLPISQLDPKGVIGKKALMLITQHLDVALLKPAHEIDPFKKIKLMAACQMYNDAAISVTYNLPETFPIDDVELLYKAAYDNGLKSIAIYRNNSRQGIYIFEDPITNESKFTKKEALCDSKYRPTEIIPTCAPRRSQELPCDITFTSIKGETWVVLVGLLHGRPYEVFCGSSEDLYLPRTCTNGVLRKQGQGKYELEVLIRKSPVVYKDLASILMTDAQKGLTRLLSLNLRHGVKPRYIVEQLRKTGGNISDFSTAISRILSKYVDTYTLEGTESKCPICGEQSLSFVEGCVKCVNCDYSRCG